ncbi:hypothetical protein [Poseidonibacter ostreae]|uniref:Uncharacterized protein n=1 Tax=Poseidonibacter ostreae TaxID=2654171 RepID=A0A6L4WXC2_9BACT|nr:hypothetical protein [Poseidonibacter ostreae]KAB7891403.1 hypothetical protein GBG19_00775 [Poseidonibacter ostreae]
MKKYNLDFESEPQQENESSYISIKVEETIERNEALGDQIGIYKENNSLEFDEYIDVDDEDIREFIEDNFNSPKAVLGFVRRLTS